MKHVNQTHDKFYGRGTLAKLLQQRFDASEKADACFPRFRADCPGAEFSSRLHKHIRDDSTTYSHSIFNNNGA